MKSTLPVVLWFLLLLMTANAQEFGGKPRYAITVTRDGAPLGEISVELFPDIAPKHVANFDSLVGIGFYNRTVFHRVIPGFMIQGGDPNSKDKPRAEWGYGDPTQREIPAEFNRISHRRGILSAARSNDPNSATSQFFICVGNPTHLDNNYTAYGRVLEGMDVVDTIVMSPRDVNDNPLARIEMTITRSDTDRTTPAAASLVAPADAAEGIKQSDSLRWTPVPGAILYHLQIARTDDFTSSIIDTMVPPETFSPKGLQALTSYYWRVRASDGGTRGEFSPVWSFSTVVGAPTLKSPLNGNTSAPINPTVVWMKTNGALSYRLQLSRRSSFDTLLLDQSGLTDTTYTLNALAGSTRYYWRVSAVGPSGEGAFSSARNFTTVVVASVDNPIPEAVAGFEVTAGNGSEAIAYLRLSRSSSVRVTLVDGAGRELRTLLEGKVPEGGHRISVDLRPLASGLYFCRLETGDGVAVRKLIVVR